MNEQSEDRQSVLIAAFEGWNDAGQAATNVVRHLVDVYDAREVRHISCDGYYDYQVSRPVVCHVSGRRRIVWPQTTFYDIEVAPGRHLFAQIAPEPNYRWAAYCHQSLHLAEELDVNRIVTLGAMFADCPHTRQLPLSVCDEYHVCDGEACYNGPVGIPTVLEEFARQEGFATTSMWVALPQYLGDDECAAGTLRLLDRLSETLGIELDRGNLDAKARRWRAQADMLLRCNDDLADYVARLERDRDLSGDMSFGSPEQAGERLAAEAEAFLRNQ